MHARRKHVVNAQKHFAQNDLLIFRSRGRFLSREKPKAPSVGELFCHCVRAFECVRLRQEIRSEKRAPLFSYSSGLREGCESLVIEFSVKRFPSGVSCANFPSRKSWRELLCALKPWRGREKGTAQCVWQTQYFHFATSEPPNLFSPSIFPPIFLDENSIRNIFTRRLISHAFLKAYRDIVMLPSISALISSSVERYRKL